MAKLLPRTWYLIGVGLMVSAAAMAGIAWSSMSDRVEGMQRVVMPGRASLTVPAGTSTLYFERESVVGGKPYRSEPSVVERCYFAEQDQIAIRQSTGKVKYSLGDFAGRNTFDVETAQAGTYTLICDAKAGQQFVLALGRGVGSAIVVAVIALVPFLLGLLSVIAIFIVRRTQRRRAG